jgi:hypothetical protein
MGPDGIRDRAPERLDLPIELKSVATLRQGDELAFRTSQSRARSPVGDTPGH